MNPIWYLWQLRDKKIMGTVDPKNHDPSVHFWDYAGYMMRRFPCGTKSLLDVGIGSGWLGSLVRAIYGFKADAVEGFGPYIQNAKELYGNIYIGNAPKVLTTIPRKSYDVVVCLNAIEHFEDPVSVLSEMERIAKRKVFVSSLNYFTPSLSWDANPLQYHKSLITSRDVKSLGYEVSNCGTLTDWFGRAARLLPHMDSGYLAWKTL